MYVLSYGLDSLERIKRKGCLHVCEYVLT